jgi:hypothetical protein
MSTFGPDIITRRLLFAAALRRPRTDGAGD